MSTLLQRDTIAGPSYVSTGTLPPDELVATLVSEAHKRFQSHTEGKNSEIYPALARVPSELFGICVVGTSGKIAAIGDTDYEFAIMSVSKPFVFALVCQEVGPTKAREKLGANSTGLPFNSLSAIERSRRRTHQPHGELRRHRYDQPRAGRKWARAMAVHRQDCLGSRAEPYL